MQPGLFARRIIKDGTRLIAVGGMSKASTSTDGITWQDYPYGITYGISIADMAVGPSNTFIAAGDQMRIIRSTDNLATWQSMSNSTSTSIFTSVSNGSLWLLAGDSGNILSSSDDLRTFNIAVVPTSNALLCSAWTGSRFVVGGQLGVLFSSTDGINWTTLTSGVGGNIRGNGL